MARLQLPIPKIINGVVNGPTAANTTCSFDVIQNKCLTGVDVTATVVTVANAGVKAIPTLAMALGEARFIIGSSNQRRRTIAQLFGANGLNALNDFKLGGMVQYFQAGVPCTALLNGVLVGTTPEFIGSAADVAIQAAAGGAGTNPLVISVPTTAKFYLPFVFAEDFRKDVVHAEAMALPIAYADAQGNVAASIGSVLFQLDIPPVPNTAGLASSVSITVRLAFNSSVMTVCKEGVATNVATDGDLKCKHCVAQKQIFIAQTETKLVEMVRIELTTFSMPLRRSTK